jgi:hypothetical protein
MTKRFYLTAAASALLIAPLSFAAVSATDNSSAASSKDGNKVKEKKICHSETPTGSIRPVRVCRTQAEIDAANQQAQDQIDRANRLSSQPTSGLRGG